MADCSYKYTDDIPTTQLSGWFPNDDGTMLVQGIIYKKGLNPFGHGILTEDKLTDPICEWLLTKPELAQYLVKKNNSDKELDKKQADIDPNDNDNKSKK